MSQQGIPAHLIDGVIHEAVDWGRVRAVHTTAEAEEAARVAEAEIHLTNAAKSSGVLQLGTDPSVESHNNDPKPICR